MATWQLAKWIRGDDDDDDGSNMLITYLGVGLLMLMLISLFNSCTEFRYMTAGRVVQAKVEQSEETQDDSGTVDGYLISCTVIDPTTKKSLAARFSISKNEIAKYPLGAPVDIEYLGDDPADFHPRIQGTHDYFWVGMFFTFVALLGGGFVWGCIHWSRVNAADKRGRKRR